MVMNFFNMVMNPNYRSFFLYDSAYIGALRFLLAMHELHIEYDVLF